MALQEKLFTYGYRLPLFFFTNDAPLFSAFKLMLTSIAPAVMKIVKYF